MRFVVGLLFVGLAFAQYVPPGGGGTSTPSGPAGGDLGGSFPNPTVTSGAHITNASIPNTGLVNTGVTVNGTSCVLGATCTPGAAPSGTAGGDLSNTYPNPTVAKVNGNVPGGTCTNQFPRVIDSSGRPTCDTVQNTDLASPTITVEGVTCTLGGSCTPVTANQNTRTIGAVFGSFQSGASALSAAATACVPTYISGTIASVEIVGNVSGSATIDVRTVAFSSWTGTASVSSIAASDVPTLSSATKYTDSTLTGWTTTLTAGTVVCFVMTAPTTVAGLGISMKVTAN